jgi:hypothetical protein
MYFLTTTNVIYFIILTALQQLSDYFKLTFSFQRREKKGYESLETSKTSGIFTTVEAPEMGNTFAQRNLPDVDRIFITTKFTVVLFCSQL